MKLQKVLNRKVKEKPYWKWRIAIPTGLVEELGWTKGENLAFERTRDGILLRRAELPGVRDDAKTITGKSMTSADSSPFEMGRRDQIVRDLHQRGFVDREIAERLAVSISTVCRTRKKMGLAPNGPGRKQGRKTWDPRRARKFHNQGLTDRQIAVKLGVSRETISKWRREQHLAPNGRPGPRPAGENARGMEVVCHRCRNRWNYRGLSHKISCPQCKTTITMAD